MPFLGFWDLLILLVFVLLVFGPKRLPQMGRSIGGGIHGLREAVTERHQRGDARAQLDAGHSNGAQPPAPREHDTVT